jgi:hypothetical protein
VHALLQLATVGQPAPHRPRERAERRGEQTRETTQRHECPRGTIGRSDDHHQPHRRRAQQRERRKRPWAVAVHDPPADGRQGRGHRERGDQRAHHRDGVRLVHREEHEAEAQRVEGESAAQRSQQQISDRPLC